MKMTIESPLVASFKPSKKSKAAPEAAEAKEYSAPSPTERMHAAAHDARVSATRDWVEGRISTKKHEQIHARANRVLKGKV